MKTTDTTINPLRQRMIEDMTIRRQLTCPVRRQLSWPVE